MTTRCYGVATIRRCTVASHDGGHVSMEGTMLNHDHDPVAGELLGPTLEQDVYHCPECRDGEMNAFWSIVEGLVQSFPGTYDDVPAIFREEGAVALLQNS